MEDVGEFGGEFYSNAPPKKQPHRVIYEGPRNKAVQYFNELGYQNDKDTNPADFICEVAGGMVCGGGMDPNVSYGESHIKSPRGEKPRKSPLTPPPPL